MDLTEILCWYCAQKLSCEFISCQSSFTSNFSGNGYHPRHYYKIYNI